jgi:tRNA-specific 2-thiouridylase
MELCFAGAGDYRLALDDKQANRQGDITDMRGNKIATHKGISNYTLGQRQGIGYAGGKPLYVGKIDAEKNVIALGTRQEVSTHTITAIRINILIPEELTPGKTFLGKIRSYGDPQPCKLTDISQDSITVDFDQPQFAPCPGQRLVLYNNSDNIVVGGTISAIK